MSDSDCKTSAVDSCFSFSLEVASAIELQTFRILMNVKSGCQKSKVRLLQTFQSSTIPQFDQLMAVISCARNLFHANQPFTFLRANKCNG